MIRSNNNTNSNKQFKTLKAQKSVVYNSNTKNFYQKQNTKEGRIPNYYKQQDLNRGQNFKSFNSLNKYSRDSMNNFSNKYKNKFNSNSNLKKNKKNYNSNYKNKKQFKVNRYKKRNLLSRKYKNYKLINKLYFLINKKFKIRIKPTKEKKINYNFLLSLNAFRKNYILNKFSKNLRLDKFRLNTISPLYTLFKFKKFFTYYNLYKKFRKYSNFYKTIGLSALQKQKQPTNTYFNKTLYKSKFRKNNSLYKNYNNNKLSVIFQKLASNKLKKNKNKKFSSKKLFNLEKKFVLLRLIKKKLFFLKKSFLNVFKRFFIYYNDANRYCIYSQKKKLVYYKYFYKHFLERKKNSNYFKFFFLKNKRGSLFSFFKTCRLLRHHRSLRYLIQRRKKKKKLGYYARRRLHRIKRPRKNRRILKKFDDISFLVGCLNRHGKKNKAISIFVKMYFFFKKELYLRQKLKKEKQLQSFSKSVLYLIIKSISLATPALILRPKTIAGKKHKIPYLAPLLRRRRMGIRWIVKSARDLKEAKPFFQKLAKIFLDTLQNKGSVIKRKKEYYTEFLKGRLYVRFLKPIQKKKNEKFKKTRKKKKNIFRSK